MVKWKMLLYNIATDFHSYNTVSHTVQTLTNWMHSILEHSDHILTHNKLTIHILILQFVGTCLAPGEEVVITSTWHSVVPDANNLILCVDYTCPNLV